MKDFRELVWHRKVKFDSTRGGYGGVVDVVSGKMPESFQPLEQIMLENDLGEANIVIELEILYDIDAYKNPLPMLSSITRSAEFDLAINNAYLSGKPYYEGDQKRALELTKHSTRIGKELQWLLGTNKNEKTTSVAIPMNIAQAIFDEFADNINSLIALLDDEALTASGSPVYLDFDSAKTEGFFEGLDHKQVKNIAKMISEDVNEHFDVD